MFRVAGNTVLVDDPAAMVRAIQEPDRLDDEGRRMYAAILLVSQRRQCPPAFRRDLGGQLLGADLAGGVMPHQSPPSPAVASGASAFPPVGDVVTPYYDADGITLYLGDCREVTEWLAADVLVTDPPYGKKWGQHGAYHGGSGHRGIAGDGDTSVRDHAISAFSDKPMLVFGAQVVPAPPGAKQSLVWHKSRDAGVFGSIAGWRRDWEQVYVLGTWPKQPAQRSSVIHIGGGLSSYLKGTHPHAKPVPLLAQLIEHCPPGVIADPFAGSGSTLVAARSCGRQAIGVEIEERYCEITATRLAQGDLPLAVGGAS